MKPGLVILLCLVCACARAQTNPDTVYQVEVSGTVSPMINFFRHPRLPETTSTTSFGYGISARGMWHPGRLLSVGLLTGYFAISEDEFSTNDLHYTTRLAAVPLQLALSMQKHFFEFGVGIGPYLMLSTIEGGHSTPAHGSRLELGMTVFGSYVFSLSDLMMIGPEVRMLYFRYRGILCLMPSCSFRINALRY